MKDLEFVWFHYRGVAIFGEKLFPKLFSFEGEGKGNRRGICGYRFKRRFRGSFNRGKDSLIFGQERKIVLTWNQIPWLKRWT